MPWILNEVNKPVFVGLGSREMMNARNCFVTELEAKEAQQKVCVHETILGNSSNGRLFCADCSRPMN